MQILYHGGGFSSESDLRQYATGQDPINSGGEGFANMNSERSVCRTRNIGISQTIRRRLSFNEISDLVTTHPTPTNEGEVSEVSQSKLFLDRYQEDPVPLHGSFMNYEDVLTLKNHPKSKKMAEPKRDVNTDDGLRDPPMLKQTSGEGQDILVGVKDIDFETI